MKSQRSLSIPRAIRSSLLAAIKLAVFGQWTLEMKFKYSRVMKTKSSHVHSTTREILLLLDQKITLAEFGRTVPPLRPHQQR